MQGPSVGTINKGHPHLDLTLYPGQVPWFLRGKVRLVYSKGNKKSPNRASSYVTATGGW